MNIAQSTFTLKWGNAVKISCCFHLLLLSAMGLAANDWLNSQVQQEHFVEVELSALDLSPQLIASALPPQQVEQQQAVTAKATDNMVAENSSPISTDEIASPIKSSNKGVSWTEVPLDNGAGISSSNDVKMSNTVQAIAVEANEGSRSDISENDRLTAVERFLLRVEDHKDYPYMAMKRNLEGRSVIAVELAADGSLNAAELLVSSGVASLDKAALKAIQNACPFVHGLGEPLAMNVPVSYKLGGS